MLLTFMFYNNLYYGYKGRMAEVAIRKYRTTDYVKRGVYSQYLRKRRIGDLTGDYSFKEYLDKGKYNYRP